MKSYKKNSNDLKKFGNLKKFGTPSTTKKNGILILVVLIILTVTLFACTLYGVKGIQNNEITIKNEKVADVYNKSINNSILQILMDEEADDTSTTLDEDLYDAQVELNFVDQNEENVIVGNKVRITDVTEQASQDLKNDNEGESVGTDEQNVDKESGLKIDIFSLTSGDEIEVDEDKTFDTNGEGVLINLSSIQQNKEYKIMIEDLEVGEKYSKSINSVVLQLLVDEDENIIAQLLNVKDVSDNPLEVLAQQFAKLHGINNDGKVTIEPGSTDPNITIQYKTEEDEDWQEYTNEVKITNNGNVQARVTKEGNTSEISVKLVNNIDKEEPRLTEHNQDNGGKLNQTTLTFKLTDNASGITQYGISTSEDIAPDKYIKADDDLTDEDILEHRNETPKLEVSGTIEEIYENGDYYLWIWDSAGNCAKELIQINSVREIEVAKIIAAPDDNKDLIGKTYRSLRKAIEACPTTGETTIILLMNIENEYNEIDNKNIKLTLGGYTLNNKSENQPALTVKANSTLTIVNTNESGEVQTSGSIISHNSEAIKVEENGNLILRS